MILNYRNWNLLCESSEQEDALKDLFKLGLIDSTEFAQRVFKLFPNMLGIAEVELTLDWGWASNHAWTELEESMLGRVFEWTKVKIIREPAI